MMKNLAGGTQLAAEENMSNLTSTISNEAISVSSNNGGIFSPHYNHHHHDFPAAHPASNQAQPPLKKKRNQPGHPDPEAEVISLSPRSLLATNRFVCEICNKGFQRDQNLQLHRRGHNLPWKLKQRSTKDVVRKKVYVCPETSCVHHEPSRALGDLTGIKKHFSRKHGEKKWKCDKCSKKYAVQSDWKAHSKTCGTREYRCDCGTLFSRRDSFITHRAFCDALAEESARSITAKNASHIQQIQSQFVVDNPSHRQIPTFPMIKKEQQQQQQQSNNFMNFPAWLSHPNYPQPLDLTPSSPSLFQDFHQNPNPNLGSTLLNQYPPPPPPPPPHISATALLQKAAQMGSKSSSSPGHVSAAGGLSLLSSSRDGFIGSTTELASYGNIKAANVTVTGGTMTGHSHNHNNYPSSSLFHDMMMMGNPGTFDHDHQGFEESLDFHAALDEFSRGSRNDDEGGDGRDNNGIMICDGMTRDFLGLRALSQSDIMSIAGLSNCMDSRSNGNNCNNNN